MINVLHIIDTGGPGGAETVFLNTSVGLDPARFRSTCVVNRDGWLAEQLRRHGHEPILEAASGSFNGRYLRNLLRIARAHRTDVIAAHLFGSAVYGGLAAMAARLPMISILHGQTDIVGAGRFTGIKRWIARTQSDRLVFVSEQLQTQLARSLGAPASKCVVIPNGVDLERFKPQKDTSLRQELQLADDAILIGAIGNIRQPKAYDVFIRAAQLLAARSPRYRFVIAGEGSGELYQRLLQLRAELGLENTVTFLGLRSDVGRVLGNLDVYALSSSTEGFSIACIEAMACAVPVVATRSGGPEQIVVHDDCGLLVPVNDPASLAAAIERIAMDPALAARFAARGQQRVQERFALRSMLGAYEKLISEVAGTKRPS